MSMFVSPRQRATWDRLKAENHPYYVHCLAQGMRDNTAAPRYASLGRWSAVSYLMSGDKLFAQKSYDSVKNGWPDKTFASAPNWSSNTLREFGTEMVMTLDWIKDALTEAEVHAWRDWLFRTADAVLKTLTRMNDSDQVVGTHFFLATLDRAWGTTYCTHPQAVAMRERVRYFCSVLAEGGDWLEGMGYNTGTTYLLFIGAEAAGIEHYPEVVTYREALTKLLPHIFTPDLKDSFEWGDDQEPHDIHWLGMESLFAYLGQFSAEIRQLEADVRLAGNKPFGAPFYARYFVHADPFAARAPWRALAGTYLVAKGQGHVYSRTGWSPTDAALMAMMPTFSLGRVDHYYMIFGDFRYRKGATWAVDRPIAYSGDLRLANHTIIANIGAPAEVGALTGAADFPKLTYVSGSNAGVFADVGRASPIPTLLHEHTRSIVWLKDRDVILVLDRLHLDTVVQADLAPFAETADKPKVIAAPVVQTLWQSQRVQPTVTASGDRVVITGDSRIAPLYPATATVVDQVPLAVGTIHTSEKRWHVTVVPTQLEPMSVLTTLIGEAEVVIERFGDVQRIRVTKAGFTDVVLYSSHRAGAKLVTTLATNQWGGKTTLHDPTKIAHILAARALEPLAAWAEAGADVYVERADGLAQLGVDEELPTEHAQLVAALAEITRQEDLVAQAQIANVLLGDVNRALTTENTAQRSRADAAEGVVQDVREIVQ